MATEWVDRYIVETSKLSRCWNDNRKCVTHLEHEGGVALAGGGALVPVADDFLKGGQRPFVAFPRRLELQLRRVHACAGDIEGPKRYTKSDQKWPAPNRTSALPPRTRLGRRH